MQRAAGMDRERWAARRPSWRARVLGRWGEGRGGLLGCLVDVDERVEFGDSEDAADGGVWGERDAEGLSAVVEAERYLVEEADACAVDVCEVGEVDDQAGVLVGDVLEDDGLESGTV